MDKLKAIIPNGKLMLIPNSFSTSPKLLPIKICFLFQKISTLRFLSWPQA